MATALITGAAGLIGRHVLEQWRDLPYDPVPVQRERDDLLVGGAAQRVLDRVRPEVVVHLAWTASGTPDYRTSAENDGWRAATLELARACLDRGVAFCGTGTALDTADPTDAYSTSKHALRRELEPLISDGAVTWFRPYYVFDPVLRRPRLVSEALAAADSGVPVVLRTADSRHDFVHAADVGRGIVAAVRAGLTGEVDLGSGVARRVGDLVTALGVEWRREDDGPAGSALHDHRPADTTRLRALGWKPTETDELLGPWLQP